jgi:hypothetical protein
VAVEEIAAALGNRSLAVLGWLHCSSWRTGEVDETIAEHYAMQRVLYATT